jgi:hypothetical protein
VRVQVDAGVVSAVLVGAAFLVAGAGKLASRTWPAQAAGLGAPAWTIPVLPWSELVLGALLVAQLARPLAAALAAALLVAFTTLLVVRLAQGQRPPCACFGGRSTRPIGPWSVVRNVTLFVLAIVALVG